MVDSSEVVPVKKASRAKTAAFILIVIVLLILLWGALQALQSTGDEPASNGLAAPTAGQDSVKSPDPVKAETGDTDGTTPSPTGTGPGSDNSLLGPR